MKKSLAAIFAIALSLAAGVATAGPVIIAGTDTDDHGGVTAGVNRSGWLFMQRAFENLASQVSNGNTSIVCIGCNPGKARNAFDSAISRSSIAGTWTGISLTSATDIANFFNGTGITNINNAGIIYMPTATANVGGGIRASQLGVVNANAGLLNSFVGSGGGLFTQDQAPIYVTGGYDWLSTLLPGLIVHGDVDGTIDDSSSLSLTALGMSAFPSITDTILSSATPWHDWFSGNFGGLNVLATGPASLDGSIFDGAVILGGGAGTIIALAQPDSLPLFGIATFGLVLALLRKRRSIH
jgi:hypothetical protein